MKTRVAASGLGPEARSRPAMAALVALALALTGCAHTGGTSGGDVGSADKTPVPDSITVALWHFDEGAGTTLFDSGPFRLAATAGIDVRPDFGRVKGARRFQRTLDSFVYAPPNPLFVPASGFSCEMWINPSEYGQYELTPLAACWNEQPNQQSWMFALCGRNLAPPVAYLPSPGYFAVEVPTQQPGQLVFIFQPEAAGALRTFFSGSVVQLNRWTHVAVTFDDSVVRFWVDGHMDAQYASPAGIRPSPAPLLMGNYFDLRYLTNFQGSLHANVADSNPYYAFVGGMDEIRISSAARTDFPRRER
ncbi:MAG: LamG domain-containing protein [Candidatus Eisenbacteria bacterium]